MKQALSPPREYVSSIGSKGGDLIVEMDRATEQLIEEAKSYEAERTPLSVDFMRRSARHVGAELLQMPVASEHKPKVENMVRLIYSGWYDPAEREWKEWMSGQEPTGGDLSAQQLLEWMKARASRAAEPRFLPDGQLVLREHHEGVVVGTSNEEVVIRYGKRDNAFELTYGTEQLVGWTPLGRGDRIEACVVLWREPHRPKGVNHYFSDEELADFETWGRNQSEGDLIL